MVQLDTTTTGLPVFTLSILALACLFSVTTATILTTSGFVANATALAGSSVALGKAATLGITCHSFLQNSLAGVNALLSSGVAAAFSVAFTNAYCQASTATLLGTGLSGVNAAIVYSPILCYFAQLLPKKKKSFMIYLVVLVILELYILYLSL